MARGEQRSNREKKKPKKATIKTIAAAPSQKGAAAGWQPNLASGKKKLKSGAGRSNDGPARLRVAPQREQRRQCGFWAAGLTALP